MARDPLHRHRQLELSCRDENALCALFVDGKLEDLGWGGASCLVRTGQLVRYFVRPSRAGATWKLVEVGAHRERQVDAGRCWAAFTDSFRTRRMPARPGDRREEAEPPCISRAG